MKRVLIIAGIISLLFIFGCNKKPSTTDTINTGELSEENNKTTTGDTEIQTGIDKKEPILATTGDIKDIIDEYKTNNTGNGDKLNENDIELMEKVIDKIEKK